MRGRGRRHYGVKALVRQDRDHRLVHGYALPRFVLCPANPMAQVRPTSRPGKRAKKEKTMANRHDHPAYPTRARALQRPSHSSCSHLSRPAEGVRPTPQRPTGSLQSIFPAGSWTVMYTSRTRRMQRGIDCGTVFGATSDPNAMRRALGRSLAVFGRPPPPKKRRHRLPSEPSAVNSYQPSLPS